MRSKKALINSMTSLLAQIVTIVCGFILPRLILSAFGSSYNGITSSITQFMNCVILLRAGVGGVTRAALYKPLADKNYYIISGIVNATQDFMKKISVIFAGALLLFASIYPLMVADEFDWLFSFSLVLIIGISTVAQNYFGITYQMLIQADQHLYVYTIINIVTTLLNTLVSAVMILAGGSIHMVKLVSTVVFVLNPIVLNIYVRKYYKIDRTVPADKTAISQRWDAFAQQVAAFINNNTDVIVLTMFTNIKEVSVYTVYYMVAGGLCRIEQTLTNGIDAAFGNMMAKKEKQLLRDNFDLFEYIIFATSTFIFTCGGVLIVPFVAVYTRGITDVDYIRYIFGILMCINQFLFCVRLPYQMLVEAAGHFKQTRNGAIFEAFLNIVLSVILVIKFGIIGVTIGTFCALGFRTLQYATYSSKNIVDRSMFYFGKIILSSACEACLISIISVKLISKIQVTSYSAWVISGVIVAMVAAVIIGMFSLVLYKKELLAAIGKIKRLKNRRG